MMPQSRPMNFIGSLETNIRRAKNRDFINAAYDFTKVAFPKKVQEHWERLEADDIYRMADA